MEIELGSGRRSKDQELGVGGKIFLTIFLSLFGGMGLLFFVMIGNEVVETIGTYSWSQNQCHISSSQIQEDNSNQDPFTLEVSYSYSVGGQSYHSNTISTAGSSYGSYGDAQRELNRYQPNSRVVCYVNGSNPAESVLERRSLWFAAVLLFPLPFMLIGFGGIYGVWFWKGKQKGKTRSISQKATSEGTRGAKIGMSIFFSVFLFAGLAAGYFLFYKPVMKSLSADTWVRTEAVVESSRVKSHSSDDGTTYSVDILYAYSASGRRYKSNQYSFFGGSSSGYDSKKEVIRQYPQGRRFDCWVNPEDPTEAVISRELGWELLLGLIPLVFILVGGGGVYYTLKSKKSSRGTSPANWGAPADDRFGVRVSQPEASMFGSMEEQSWLPSYENKATLLPSGEYELKPLVSAKLKLIGVILIAALWNGIISIPISEAIEGWQNGSPDWMLSLFMIPFALIGLLLIVGIFYMLLSLTNAKPRLLMPSLNFKPGSRTSIQWRLLGRTSSVRELTIQLKGTEEATYRRGTSTYTDRNVFYEREIGRAAGISESSSGSIYLEIPEGALHSFEGSNNKIIWEIALHGVIDRWPDIKEEWPIAVLPE